jgi:hypothetical protein
MSINTGASGSGRGSMARIPRAYRACWPPHAIRGRPHQPLAVRVPASISQASVFRIRTPTPPSFAVMNSAPTVARAACNFSRLGSSRSPPFSKRLTAEVISPESLASALGPSPAAIRAATNCAGVMPLALRHPTPERASRPLGSPVRRTEAAHPRRCHGRLMPTLKKAKRACISPQYRVCGLGVLFLPSGPLEYPAGRKPRGRANFHLSIPLPASADRPLVVQPCSRST